MSSSNRLGKLKLRRILSSLKSMCFLRGRLDDFSTVAFPAIGKIQKISAPGAFVTLSRNADLISYLLSDLTHLAAYTSRRPRNSTLSDVKWN